VLVLGDQPVRRVALFTAGVFVVSTAAGLVLLFAFGRTVVSRFAHPSLHTRHVAELVIGVALLVAAGLLWIVRDRLREHISRTSETGGRSSLVLGAGIMLVELPTAFPYFGALLAILGVKGPGRQAFLVVAYSVVFVAPLLCLLVVAAAGGSVRRRLGAR